MQAIGEGFGFSLRAPLTVPHFLVKLFLFSVTVSRAASYYRNNGVRYKAFGNFLLDRGHSVASGGCLGRNLTCCKAASLGKRPWARENRPWRRCPKGKETAATTKDKRKERSEVRQMLRSIHFFCFSFEVMAHQPWRFSSRSLTHGCVILDHSSSAAPSRFCNCSLKIRQSGSLSQK